MRSLKIAGVERWPDLEKNSMAIEQALTYAVDTCSFAVKGDMPAEGEEVIIEEDGVRYFSGIIVKVELLRTFPSKTIKVWKVDCDDYTALLDRRLVVETYENKPADWIFQDITAKYCPDFTVTGVQAGAPVVETTGDAFKYKRPSECFKWLCDYVGWNWEPDYFKDLSFYDAEELAMPAPMELVPGGKFKFGRHSIDIQGLRNRVYVIGGKMMSGLQTVQWRADGVSRHWTLPWGPHEIQYNNELARIGIDEITYTVGTEYLHDDVEYDYMLSYMEKYIKCSSKTPTPPEGATISFDAKQDIDVITVVDDYDSQDAVAAIQGGDGVYEHVITDNSLTTLDAAEVVGLADLREHANPKVSGYFDTRVPGWFPGQLVTINLPDRGVVGTFLVQSVTIAPIAPYPSIWSYRINYGSRLKGVADFLKAMASAQQNVPAEGTTIIKILRSVDKVEIGDKETVYVFPAIPPYKCGDYSVDAICGYVELK